MPTPCYLSIEGKVQGNITAGAFTAESVGNIFVEGHEDEMLVQEIEHTVMVPTDRQSGQPTGQRRHKPFVATVTPNKSVPLLYNSLTTGELLTKVSVNWYRTSIEGKQEHFFTILLTDAVIVDIVCDMPHCLDASSENYTQILDVAFSYRKIEWIHEVSGTTGYDDWRKPIA